MPEELKRELLAIADALDGLLHWEHELSGDGFPAVNVPEVTRALAPPSAAPPRSAPSSGRAAPEEAWAHPTAQASNLSRDPSLAPHAPAVSPVTTTVQGAPRSLAMLQAEAAACSACGLHAGRTKSVFARGSERAEVVFVGEGPGYHEDQSGEPFVGAAGQLLDNMIAAMGYGRDEVYVCNVVKCRPPDNRTPLPAEAEACSPYLRGQLAAVQPQVIVALGKCATEALGCMREGQRKWRGVWSEYAGVPVMPTYHPAFLLRSPQFKRDVWADLQLVMARVGKTPRAGGAR
ncbi:MAG: uracil-DNA glycosylase [Polyangiales bacterium]|nr:uracil-DNA glycosylase [Myxococcales bacterium]MCB9658726.1 uracil-DNA glycosylase [Sandaracinaceae bacterium]